MAKVRHRRWLYNRRSEFAAATVGADRYGYAYDAENRLVSVTSSVETNGAIRVLNAYDHRNRRIRKTVQRLHSTIAPPSSPPVGIHEWETQETHTFVWDGSNIVLERVEFANGTTRTFEYFWGTDKSGSEQGAGGVEGLLAVSMDGVFCIPCYDHNGNIVLYVSETGSIAAQYVYDPYGNVVETYGNLAEAFSFGFSTKYHDRETGMVGYQRRFYRPDLGRWLNRDPIEEEGGENLYAFCLNNPLGSLDVMGMVNWESVLNGGLQMAAGILSMKVAAASIVGSGGMSAPAAYFLFAWASATIANGYSTLAAGLSDRGPPEALQVQVATKMYETAMRRPMSAMGTNVTYAVYYFIDIRCACYSIQATWNTMIQRGIVYRKYAEIPLFTKSGIQVIKTDSAMEFVVTVPGAMGAAGSVLLDYKSLFSDVYEMSDMIFNDEEADR